MAAAGHQSTSLPHVENEHGDWEIPSEIAIAAGDMLNSDMAKVAGLLMFSSPFILGDSPEVQTEKGPRKPRDYRDIYRRIMGTTVPGEMIMTPEILNDRITQGIVNGDSHTIDRTAYRTKFEDGTDALSYHGPVRLRMAKDNENERNPFGRIEVTEAGASFSLLDYYAFATIVDVMKLGSFEAVANGKHPIEYWGDKYSTLRGSSDRVDIGDGYNLHGGEDPKAAKAIHEMIEFLDEMADNYPPYRKNIAFAKARVANLLATTVARNFDEYMDNPTGQVTEVMRYMRDKEGMTPTQIAYAVTKYEYELADKILENDGDATKVYAVAA